MLKFIKPFKGCKQGDIYPTQFTEGEECPPELEAAAIDTESVEPDEAAPPVQPQPAADEPEKSKPGKKAEK